MRTSLFFSFVFALAACGGGSTHSDMSMKSVDLSMGPDLSASQPDMTKPVTPYNMPGMVFCYDAPACSTSSAMAVCCDAAGADGGFSDTCVANANACAGTGSRTYACGQAADCTTGQVCCGTTKTSSSGKLELTGTNCAASCATGQTQLCVTAGECSTSGATCAGQDASGRDVGLCM